MNPNAHQSLNIWALPKAAELRLVLLTMQETVSIGRLILDCAENPNRQALLLCDAQIEDLSAYLFTFGQSKERYGLQLNYPALSPGALPPYEPMEELTLKQVIDQLCMHFELV
ncbi:MAG: hypothetical protein P8103_13240 [Candidatus Thiodiazotropha sp.]